MCEGVGKKEHRVLVSLPAASSVQEQGGNNAGSAANFSFSALFSYFDCQPGRRRRMDGTGMWDEGCCYRKGSCRRSEAGRGAVWVGET